MKTNVCICEAALQMPIYGNGIRNYRTVSDKEEGAQRDHLHVNNEVKKLSHTFARLAKSTKTVNVQIESTNTLNRQQFSATIRNGCMGQGLQSLFLSETHCKSFAIHCQSLQILYWSMIAQTSFKFHFTSGICRVSTESSFNAKSIFGYYSSSSWDRYVGGGSVTVLLIFTQGFIAPWYLAFVEHIFWQRRSGSEPEHLAHNNACFCDHKMISVIFSGDRRLSDRRLKSPR